jgi:hypothetical protein
MHNFGDSLFGLFETETAVVDFGQLVGGDESQFCEFLKVEVFLFGLCVRLDIVLKNLRLVDGFERPVGEVDGVLDAVGVHCAVLALHGEEMVGFLDL